LKYSSLFLLLPVLVLVCTTTPAFADTIPVTNASFETISSSNPLVYTSPGIGTWNIGPIPGWTSTGVAGSWQPGSGALNLPVPDGNIVAYSNGGTISQMLGASLVDYTTYILSVDIGHRLDGVNGYPTDYTIALFAGNMLLNSVSGSSSPIPLGTFATQSLSYTAGTTSPSGNLAIVLTSTGIQSQFDNVQLSATPVPEPGSLALLATGLGLAFFIFRRR
jgi:hypothetical protein